MRKSLVACLAMGLSACANRPDYQAASKERDEGMKQCLVAYSPKTNKMIMSITCQNQVLYLWAMKTGVDYSVISEWTAKRTKIAEDYDSGKISLDQARMMDREAVLQAASHDTAIEQANAARRNAEMNQAIAVGARNLRNSLPQQTICNGANYGVTYSATCTTYHY